VRPQSLIAPVPVIVVDAGHGCGEPGAVWPIGSSDPDYVEADINQAIATELVAELRARNGNVFTTNRCDDDKPRAEFANSVNADILISIHCNSSTNLSADGTCTIYAGNHDVGDSHALASDIHDELLYILFLQSGCLHSVTRR